MAEETKTNKRECDLTPSPTSVNCREQARRHGEHWGAPAPCRGWCPIHMKILL